MVEKNCYLIDWFSASGHMKRAFDEPYALQSLICDVFKLGSIFSQFEDGTGKHKYRRCLYTGSVFFYYDYPDDPKRFWVEMSGTGCRTFETYVKEISFLDVFGLCVGDDPFLTVLRVDLAYDIYNDPLLFDRLKFAVESGSVVSKFKSTEVREVKKLLGGGGAPDYTERIIYFGSRKSELFFRLYDKRLERNDLDKKSWYRLEMVFKHENGVELVNNIMSSFDDIGSLFNAYLGEYLSVRVRNETDSNYRRWSVAPWWSKFVKTACTVKHIDRKEQRYNVFHYEHLVQTMYGNAFEVLLKTIGVDRLLALIAEREQSLTIKQLDAIRQYFIDLQSGDEDE